MVITRRSIVVGLPALLGIGMSGQAAADETPIAAIERRHGGRLGVFAIDTGSGRPLAHRADERFTMCSSFKGLLAAAVLARVDAGRESLDRMVPYDEKDLIFTSPVTKAHVEQGRLPVGTLCQAILEVSDNTAAVLLTRSVGGPAALTEFIRGIGDTVTRFDRYEPYSNDYNGLMDTSTPRAIVGSARSILLGNVLSSKSRDTLEGWMAACKTGAMRVRAAFPPDWVAGDRTGTNHDEANDYVLVRPPGRAPLLVAAYYNAVKDSQEAHEAVLRDVGAAFVKWAKT